MEHLKTIFGSVLLFGAIAYGASAFPAKQDNTFGNVELGQATNVPNVVDGVLYQSTPAIAFPTTTDKRLTAFLPTGIEGKVTAVKGQSGSIAGQSGLQLIVSLRRYAKLPRCHAPYPHALCAQWALQSNHLNWTVVRKVLMAECSKSPSP